MPVIVFVALILIFVLYHVVKAAVRNGIAEARGFRPPENAADDGPVIMQMVCPDCGIQHDMDCPRCPSCGHKY